MFGLAFSIPDDWKINLLDVQEGVAAAQIKAGPYNGRTGEVFPNFLVLARPPKPGESLDDFTGLFLRDLKAKAASLPICPVQQCRMFESADAGSYKPEGGGHMMLLTFKREQPEFPGLLFESPTSLNPSESSQVQYFRPRERLRRLDGPIFYLVLLDSAESVLEKAKADYDAFLQTLIVE